MFLERLLVRPDWYHFGFVNGGGIFPAEFRELSPSREERFGVWVACMLI